MRFDLLFVFRKRVWHGASNASREARQPKAKATPKKDLPADATIGDIDIGDVTDDDCDGPYRGGFCGGDWS